MKLVAKLLKMSPVTYMFTFWQPYWQGVTDIPVHPLDLSVYLNESALETVRDFI